MNDVLAEHTELETSVVEWLHLLVGDWQLLSDLSFADLVLWVRTTDGGWVAAAHVRPTTGVGVFVEDLVGRRSDGSRTTYIDDAFRLRRVVRAHTTLWRDDVPVREECIPVVQRDVVVAVLTRHTSFASMRTPSRLEVTYLATADALTMMITQGEFPSGAAGTGGRRGAPRVGDGVLRLDVAGNVMYASPNSVSAIHRLGYVGEMVGVRLASALGDVLPERGPVDEELMLVLTGRVPWRTEIESRSACVSVRAIPLSQDGRRVGAVLLVRDVSELRRRERELLTKDATIREIHHRVKNNLQTVAAVLRLQARRLDDPGARAALEDAVRRVATIADVHETLSSGMAEAVEFDEVARRGLRAAIDLSNRSGHGVQGVLEGHFGDLQAGDATALAMILAELVQNAVEHGFPDRGGLVEVEARRTASEGEKLLTVQVRDNGRGLPVGFEPRHGGLGVQIVLSLLQDLRGDISWQERPGGGTVVRFVARLRDLS
ncbi:sensor histidine kinase [Leekyejoonella antrihumi]